MNSKLALASRSWAVAEPVRRPARVFPIRTPLALKPLPARRARLEMRWPVDADGRLYCTWQVASESTPSSSNHDEARFPSWRRFFAALTAAL